MSRLLKLRSAAASRRPKPKVKTRLSEIWRVVVSEIKGIPFTLYVVFCLIEEEIDDFRRKRKR